MLKHFLKRYKMIRRFEAENLDKIDIGYDDDIHKFQEGIEQNKKSIENFYLNQREHNKSIEDFYRFQQEDLKRQIREHLEKMEKIVEKTDFIPVRALGKGVFGSAFLVKDVNGLLMVIKVMENKHNFEKEIQCLKKVKDLGLCGKDYLCYLGDFSMKIDRNTYYFLLTEYEEGYVTLIDFFETIKDDTHLPEIKDQLTKKTRELDSRLLSHRISHNDIHSGNILIDPKTLKIKLIDFGLCTFF
jgi:thiamine kinase-like enzyme